ncbi:MAG: hypothetical protein MI924_33095 [Chloroflexales bacterium]|nr:hypothetical protein [Chloroflexales bacterium]
MTTALAQVLAQARESGYHVQRVEQLRTNRWLLTVTDSTGATVLILVQKRLLINSADVQDLAELLRLGRYQQGILLVIDGTFSPASHRTAHELSITRISLCTALPKVSPPPQMTPLFESI